jgi:DNA-binding NtrC family response regulator
LPSRTKADDGNIPERELLYKVLFDMKSDLNDLKSLVYELVRTNDLDMPDIGHSQRYNLPEAINVDRAREQFSSKASNYDDLMSNRYSSQSLSNSERAAPNDGPSVLLAETEFDHMEVVEDKLSLEDMEKEYIGKALKKYNGRRKEAADELGISERTLYRKIKQYDMQ